MLQTGDKVKRPIEGIVMEVNEDGSKVKVDSGTGYYQVPGEENRRYDSNRIVRSNWLDAKEVS